MKKDSFSHLMIVTNSLLSLLTVFYIMNSEIKLSFDTYRIYFSVFAIEQNIVSYISFLMNNLKLRNYIKVIVFDIVCQEYTSSNIYLNSIITIE